MVLKVIEQTEKIISDLVGTEVSLTVKLKDDTTSAIELLDVMIQSEVCEAFKCTWLQIVGPLRKRHLVDARAAYVHLSRTIFKMKFSQIANVLNRHHSTAMHLYELANNLIDTADPVGQIILQLKQKIYENTHQI